MKSVPCENTYINTGCIVVNKVTVPVVMEYSLGEKRQCVLCAQSLWLV